MTPLDPDPLYVEPERSTRPPSRMARRQLVAIGILYGVIVCLAFAAGRVSSRSAPDSPEAAFPGGSEPARAQSRTLRERDSLPGPAMTGRPSPTATVPTGSPKPQGRAISGQASWFRWHPGEAAAGPALRAMLGPSWRGMTVRVCGRVCITVRLSDYCQCFEGTASERIIDLDRASFAALADPARGLVDVTVTYL